MDSTRWFIVSNVSILLVLVALLATRPDSRPLQVVPDPAVPTAMAPTSAPKTVPPDHEMIPVVHDGHLAFLLTERLVSGQALTSSLIVWPDGRHALAGQPVVCGTCGKAFDWDAAIREALTR